MKVFVLKGIFLGLIRRSHGLWWKRVAFLTESKSFCPRMGIYPRGLIKDAEQEICPVKLFYVALFC